LSLYPDSDKVSFDPGVCVSFYPGIVNLHKSIVCVTFFTNQNPPKYPTTNQPTNQPTNMSAIAKHSYPIASFNFPRREKCSPGYFSSYKKFFRGTRWELFAVPFGYGPRYDALINDINSKLLPVPAVYEFAVSKSIGGKRYKVYLGQTNSMERRSSEYVRALEKPEKVHINKLMQYSLEHGLFIYRRVRYIIPNANLSPIAREKADLMSLMWETRLLAQLNYSWNTDNNGKSHARIDHTRTVKVAPFFCFFSKVQFEFADPKAKAFYKI
jgi:hypothetical protein